MEEDPLTQFLSVFFHSCLSPAEKDSPLASFLGEVTTKAASFFSPQDVFQLHSFLVEKLVCDYNSRLLLKTGHISLHKDPSTFPSLFVEHYNTNESLSWAWRRFVGKKWPELEAVGVGPPRLQINQQLAEKIQEKASTLSTLVKVERVTTMPKWRVAAFQLNSKEILEKAVKYLLSHSDDEGKLIVPLQTKNYKIELAFKKGHRKDTTGDETDSTVLLAQCVLRLCSSPSTKYFTEIPENVDIPCESVLASFSTTEGTFIEHEQILMELNSKDFYSQYSETVVILYNYARIKTILERFENLVASEEYPKLPDVDEVNFELIGDSKDEFPIILMLFMWPHVRRNIINLHKRGKGFEKINLPFLFDFVKSLARAFDSFYNRNVIIVPQSAPHNFQAMFARLYLLKGVAVVFTDFIYLAGIEMD